MSTSPHKYCKNYVINNAILPLINASIVTSVMGHIKDIDFASGYEQWNLHTLTELFHAPVNESTTAVNIKFTLGSQRYCNKLAKFE